MTGPIRRGVAKVRELDELGAHSPVPDRWTGAAIALGVIAGLVGSWFVKDLDALGELTHTYAPWVVAVAALALLDTAKDEFSGWGAGLIRVVVISVSLCAAIGLVYLIANVLLTSRLRSDVGSLPGWLVFCMIAGLVVLIVMSFVSAPRRRWEAARHDVRIATKRKAELDERKRGVEDVLDELNSRRIRGETCHVEERSGDRWVAAGFGAGAGALVAAGIALALRRHA